MNRFSDSNVWREIFSNSYIASHPKIYQVRTGPFHPVDISCFVSSCSIGQVSFSSATMFDSAEYDPQAMRALSVEQCSCGNGYTGYSCEVMYGRPG